MDLINMVTQLIEILIQLKHVRNLSKRNLVKDDQLGKNASSFLIILSLFTRSANSLYE